MWFVTRRALLIALIGSIVPGGLLVASESAILLYVDRSCTDGLNVTLDGQRIAPSDLLAKLSSSAVAGGTDREVLILAKKDTALGDLQHLRALLGKIGHEHIRFFSFDPNRKLMSEVAIDFLGIPFTTEPPPRKSSQ